MKSVDLVCFGELLWDMLPSQKVAGGAPFNIVNRSNALATSAAVISSVGNDHLGTELLELVQRTGNPITAIQVHQVLPTSVVNILVGEGGEPHYDIVKPVAWDDIRLIPEAIDLVKGSKAFVYSSLGLRSAASREVLFALLDHASLAICDINLRDGHYERSTIERMLDAAHILRMNEAELSMIATWNGSIDQSVRQQIILLHELYNYDTIIVTLGSKGAISYRNGTFVEQDVFKVLVKDTVGSGDAFLAAYISKRLNSYHESDSLRFACAIGALTASKHGGTPIILDQEVAQLLSQ